MMEPRTLTQGITADDWTIVARQAQTTPEQLQSQYEAALQNHPQMLRKIEVSAGDAVQSGDCISRDFDVSLFDVFGIHGNIEFCGTGSNDWSAKLHICLELFGGDVWCTDYTLSPTNASVCYSPDLTAVRAHFCVGIVGQNHCFNLNGNACYWAWTWHCADFNETPFCFG
jgi:hypothetical protein